MIRKSLVSLRNIFPAILITVISVGCENPFNINPDAVKLPGISTSRTTAIHEVAVSGTIIDEYQPLIGSDGESEIIVFTRSESDSSGTYESWVLIGYRIDSEGNFGPELQISPPDEKYKYLETDLGAVPDYSGVDEPVPVVIQSIQTSEINTPLVRAISIPDEQDWGIFGADEIMDVSIFEDHAAFICVRSGGSEAEVFVYDMITGKTTPISSAGAVPNAIDIGSEYMVWDYATSGGRGIQVLPKTDRWFLDRPVLSVLNDDTLFAGSPSTYGNRVAYTLSGAGITGTLIEIANMETGERVRIANDGADKSAPSFNGDLLAFSSNISGDFEVYVYRLSTGETFQVTDHPSDQVEPYLHGNKVVYQDARNGNLDVFYSVIEFDIPIEEQIADEIVEISDFVTDAVEDRTLEGDGNGNSADGRLNAFNNMLGEVELLIEAGMYEEALGKLSAILKKTDGDPRPPDFVTGLAAVELAEMINRLISDLEILLG